MNFIPPKKKDYMFNVAVVKPGDVLIIELPYEIKDTKTEHALIRKIENKTGCKCCILDSELSLKAIVRGTK